MPAPTTTTIFSENFIISAGSILFRRAPGKTEICILRYLTKDEWLLPKGRKDEGETLEEAALRETYEETGYRCTILPVDLVTRAPPFGVDMEDQPRLAQATKEPFAVQTRKAKDGGSKFIWWFVSEVTDSKQEHGTQTESEHFEAVFFDAPEAIQKLTFPADQDLARRAYELVTASNTPLLEKANR
ncbi:hypothetical protein SISNIDRAFT_495556 [Sistotremastrum niveocremeum HHB9708]|uniref:Nudix hydrolase domain-containing protein n=1 Tax=Sistotremastrum niveocremeum HHB9708 TaxID=1314777 RepID=A0A164UQ17_9AGAM|nr:hypothetical protein SISNIDRAFT_495556 [Sistotremastrum niveocremeum HHB9708]